MADDATSTRRLLVIGVPAFVAAAAVGLIAALALSSGNDSHSASAATAVTSDATAVSAVLASTSPSTSSPSPTHSHSAAPEPPSPPATTSGGLTARTLPTAKSLGAGWVFRVDNGSAEGGYVGNGTPTVARKPAEVVMTVIPLGCEQRASLPMPKAVLETDYRQRSSGIAGVALRLRFATADAAGRFTSQRHDDLVACATQRLTAADQGQHVVAGIRTTGDGTYVSLRTDVTVPKNERTWTEVSAWRGGRDVVLLAVNTSASTPDVSRYSTAARSVL